MKKVSNNNSLISVIVPIYNVEKYLDKCIGSIVNQTYINLEIILVDDGSPDNCPKLCDEWQKKDDRIKVIHKTNGGVSKARNIGIKSSNGEFIAFIDADDWIEKNYFSEMIKYMDDDVDVVGCAYNRVTKKKKQALSYFKGVKKLDNYEFLNTVLNLQSYFGFCHMKLYRKEIIYKTAFNEHLKVGEDGLFNLNIALTMNKMIYIPMYLYNYRISSESTVKKFDYNYANKYLTAIKHTKKFIFENFKDKKIYQNYYNYAAFHILLIANNYCFNKENKVNGINELKEVCNTKEFKEALKKCNYSNISLTRKICIFCLKHKLYLLIKLICKIRQVQNFGGTL